MPRYAVIVVAAGKSERFGTGESKVLAKLDGRAVFLRSVELFCNREDVCQTILVISPSDESQVREKYGANLGLLGIKVVTGGARRCESVARGLAEVREDAEYVAVHDAARPCVSEAMIEQVFAEATRSGAAILAAPLRGTIKRGSEAGYVDATIPREGLWEAQTPQVFKRQVILDAYARLSEFAGEPTDDAQLVEFLGHPVRLVPSDFSNLKITTPADMTLAGAVIRTRPKSLPKGPLRPFEEAQW